MIDGSQLRGILLRLRWTKHRLDEAQNYLDEVIRWIENDIRSEV